MKDEERIAPVQIEKLGLETRIVTGPRSSLSNFDDYQRKLKHEWANHIAKNFNEQEFGRPLVGRRRDGSLWVVDGRQRLGALDILNLPPDLQIEWEEFFSNGSEHEAFHFRRINFNRKNLTSSEQFHSRIVEGDPIAVQIAEMIEEYGFTVARAGESVPNGAIGAFGSLEAMLVGNITGKSGSSTGYRKKGPGLVRSVLSAMRDAGFTEKRCDSRLIKAVGAFINRYSDHSAFRRERLVQVLRVESGETFAKDVLAYRRAIKSKTSDAEVLLHRYNHRLADKNVLPAWSERITW